MARLNSRRGIGPLVVQCSKNKNFKNIFSKETHERTISILRNSQQLQFDWSKYLRKSNVVDGGVIANDELHKDAVQKAANERGKLSFGFSAGGCLFPYYIGTTAALIDAGLLTEETKLGGASAGSLIAACVKSGMPLDEITEQCLRLMHDCRVSGTRGRLGVCAAPRHYYHCSFSHCCAHPNISLYPSTQHGFAISHDG